MSRQWRLAPRDPPAVGRGTCRALSAEAAPGSHLRLRLFRRDPLACLSGRWKRRARRRMRTARAWVCEITSEDRRSLQRSQGPPYVFSRVTPQKLVGQRAPVRGDLALDGGLHCRRPHGPRIQRPLPPEQSRRGWRVEHLRRGRGAAGSGGRTARPTSSGQTRNRVGPVTRGGGTHWAMPTPVAGH